MVYRCANGRPPRGFTVIELLVVMAAIGLLLSVATPRYLAHLDHARETALKHNLKAMREAIDRFHADRDRYPNTLTELVERRYLKQIPADPMTESLESWHITRAAGPDGGVVDVRSGAKGQGQNGVAYAAW
ncbi:type II secretion system protein [Pseudorhodoferax sp.]|uniref:type II secretion system protein n=1 Tax=Pseudorhodoferax sp. TaxID=1993553 RepID=UPI002DD6775F|nr:prepilin-type N-terminal cleavage/methylation domain-containing protein [Pseudorhodoferax sp.]